ncbi:protein DEPP1 [Tachyglossus aculeatus]|uniref:protein DEPP1 n=1 Tax=Tachyglossus aculeatus TaxID=9261 RepID=UPI0018F575CE|nr:protein DEPP1 [Tachyglossus aculeatus]
MRSRLLLAVAHLPPISELAEELALGAACAKRGEPPGDPLASRGLDEYVLSIRRLAQPTSGPEEAAGGPVRPARAHRTRGKAPACTASPRPGEKPLPPPARAGVAPLAARGLPALTPAGGVNPLDWLFGEWRPKRPAGRDGRRRSGVAFGRVESAKARGGLEVQLCGPRGSGGPGAERRTTASDLHTVPGFSGTSPQARITHAGHAHLPVIYEL